MKKESVKSAKTIEEAIEKACQELGAKREEVSVEVLVIPKKGFLNIGSVKAKVRVTMEVGNVNKLEVAKNYLWSLLENMGLENFDIDIDEKSDKKVILTLIGDNLGLIIGKRGETLNALQHLCSVAANMSGGEYYNVIINVGDYRQSREQTLKDLALKISKSVLKSKRKITLEPMSSYERKIIHETIQDIDGVDTQSKGEEPYRCVMIYPVKNNQFPEDNKKNFDNNRNKYNKKKKRGF